MSGSELMIARAALVDIRDAASHSAAQLRAIAKRAIDQIDELQGARIADDHFCQQCGKRGVRGEFCAACERAQI